MATGEPDVATNTNDIPDEFAPPSGPQTQSTSLPGINGTTAPTQSSNLPPMIDFGDDEIGDVNDAMVPASVQVRLNEIQTRTDSSVSQHVQQIGELLDSHEINRVQPLSTNPNEIQPIRRVSGLKATSLNIQGDHFEFIFFPHSGTKSSTTCSSTSKSLSCGGNQFE